MKKSDLQNIAMVIITLVISIVISWLIVIENPFGSYTVSIVSLITVITAILSIIPYRIKGKTTILAIKAFRHLERLFGQKIWGFIFIFAYAILLFLLTWINTIKSNIGLNLYNENDRVLFQGLIALGVALFIFVQFDLDYRNRRRNILYEQQITSLMEFQSILNDMDYVLKILNESVDESPILKQIFDNEPLQFMKLPFQYELSSIKRYETFRNLGKDLFVQNLLERTLDWKKESINDKFCILKSLIEYLRKCYSELPILETHRFAKSQIEKTDYKNQKKFALNSIISISCLSSSSNTINLELIISEIQNFIRIMNKIIKYELEVL
jgi:hypothetical protein